MKIFSESGVSGLPPRALSVQDISALTSKLQEDAMADNSPHYDKYRMPIPRFCAMCLALGALWGGTTLGLNNNAITLTALVLFIVLAALVWPTGTITSPYGITVRELFGTKTIRWADIQDIRIEINDAWVHPGQYRTRKDVPKWNVVTYDRDGKRTSLPNVDRKEENFGVDLENIRSTWELLRGDDWAPIPSVRKIVDKASTGRKLPFPAEISPVESWLDAK